MERSALLVGVPTVAEQGYPGFEVSGWYGMVAPTGTPREAIMLLHTEIARILKLPEVRERVAGDGAVAVGSSPEAFGVYIRSEIAKWAPVIRASGATAE